MGIVKLDDSLSTENPLPNHNDNGVNMINGDMGRRIKEDIPEVKIPLKWVWKKMVESGLFVLDSKRNFGRVKNYCEFHNEEGHEIQECTEFRALVQGMMDDKEVDFYEEVKEEGSICASESMKVPKVAHPVIIISRPKNDEVRTLVMPKIIIKKPAIFSYQDSRKVPWNYECNTSVPGKEITEDQGIGAYPEPVKGKAITLEQKKEKIAEPVLSINEPVKEEEAVEFLKFLKHSEYSVVEQLHKQLARISVLVLLLNSEVHRSALMKVLNETYVANDISVNKLDRLVNNISADNFIFFNDDEIPPGGMGLPVDSSHMKTYLNILRAFDGTERKVMGRIEIPLLTDPTVYEVDFLVMDIKPFYNCLLWRPWIHSAGAVLSSLHQKLKLVSEGRLVTINAEEDIIVADMPGLSTDIVVHRLPIREDCKLVQQKLRRMRTDIVLKIKEEVKKQFDTGFLQVVKYSEWAIKGSAIADFLASKALEDYEPLDFDFLNEDLMCVANTEEDYQENHSWRLNFDGASNAVGNGIGAILVFGEGRRVACRLGARLVGGGRPQAMSTLEAHGQQAATRRKERTLGFPDAL
ncbi:uncharacterized protein [Gossypium hirsutum]|uniref:Reverse transcriptase domain-containing protein n=1 Tax=Gossypium hirsutum TaxID=3635 RepID=A0A1U8P7S5_GOSHI|nr:uncharacterized protein LOC107956025 [Gossypium hirsutum]